MTSRAVILSFFIGIAVIFALGSGLMLLGGADPVKTLTVMFRGSLASVPSISETLIRFGPVAVIALGLAPSLRIGLFNIGAPGQIGIGALFATLVSLQLTDAPQLVALVLSGIAAAIGGALWALGPALLRAYLRVNEILSTLVLNFLAVLFLSYLLTGPMKGHLSNIAQSYPLPESTWFPVMISDTRAHVGLLLVFFAAAALALLQRSPLGYRLRLYGASPNLARQAGTDHRRMIIGTLCLGGAAAGIGGWMQLAGVDHRLYAEVATTVGYTGLFAALLGVLHPIGILVASFAFAALLRGGDSLQIGVGVSPEIISALVGMTLLVIATTSALTARGPR